MYRWWCVNTLGHAFNSENECSHKTFIIVYFSAPLNTKGAIMGNYLKNNIFSLEKLSELH